MPRPGLPPDLSTLPTLGPGDLIGEGDSFIHHNLFPGPEADSEDGTDADTLFYRILSEVCWQKMQHNHSPVPRLVAVQGAVDSETGRQPIYRHPADEPVTLMHFSPSVAKLVDRAAQVTGQPFNHALIQLYRTGDDYISEHADKTLDIVPGTAIVNVSLGAQRTMRLRRKGGRDEPNRETQRVQMPHNSLFVLGLATNAGWLHGIMPDRRRAAERSAEELDYGGVRVSITLRCIGTWLIPSATDGILNRIYGQGAVAKTADEAEPTVDADPEASEEIIRSFGRENRTVCGPDYWRDIYTRGTNVVNLARADGETAVQSARPRLFQPPFFFSPGEAEEEEETQGLPVGDVDRMPRVSIPIPAADTEAGRKRNMADGGWVLQLMDKARTEVMGRREIEAVLSAQPINIGDCTAASVTRDGRDHQGGSTSGEKAEWAEAARMEQKMICKIDEMLRL